MSRLSACAVLAILWLPAPALAQFQGFGFGSPYGGTRYNTSFQPLLSVYNGQTSLLQFQTFNWYPTNLQVVQAGGSIAFVPQYQPIPQGLNLPIQAVQSPNGRYTRLNLAPTFGGGGIGPPQPQTTFLTPVFAGGAQGRSVPFTTVMYPPTFRTTAIQTSVLVPAGGNASLGGYRYGAIGRNEFGAPILGRIPLGNTVQGNGFFFGNANVFGAPGVFVP